MLSFNANLFLYLMRVYVLHIKLIYVWASLVAQWLRIRLPMQGTRVQALVRKIPRAAEQLSLCATTTSLHSAPREPQLLKPACLEPAHRNEE